MKCPECGYPEAAPPKCRACGAEITEEMETEAGKPVVAEEVAEPVVEEPTEEETPE